jgi:hypothetical protein
MTQEEINVLLEQLLESFRAFVAEEVEKYYGADKRIPSQEFHNLLMAFEANEMTKMFNSEWVSQDKFRVFLQSYLRVWFDWIISKIEDVGEDVAVVDSIGDLPVDGSSTIATVGGDLYYWNGTEWVKANDWKIPAYPNQGDLPADGGNIGIVGDDLYYWDGTSWIKVVTNEEFNKSISSILNNLQQYVEGITQSGGTGTAAMTYHNTVLEIVDAVPELNVGDRYLLTAGDGEDGEDAETFKTLQTSITKENNGYSELHVFDDNSVLWGGNGSSGKLIFSQDNKTYPVSGFSGKVTAVKYFNNGIYFVGDNKLYRFDKANKAAVAVTGTGNPTVEQTNITNGDLYFAAIGQDGKLYFGGVGGGIWRLDNDGQIKPTNKTTGGFRTAAMGQDGKLYFCGYDYGLGNDGIWRLDDDGQIRQTNNTDGGFNSAAMGQDGKLYFGSGLYADNGIWYLDNDGLSKWTNQTDGTFHSAAIGQDGKLYFNGNIGIWYLDNDGQIKPTNKTGEGSYCAAIGQDGKLYFGICYLDNDGLIKQTNNTYGNFISAAMGQDGKLYFGSSFNAPILYGTSGIWYLDDDGVIKQTNKTTGRFDSAAMGQDGKLYFCGSSSGIWYLDNDGLIKQTNKTTGGFHSAAIGQDGKL